MTLLLMLVLAGSINVFVTAKTEGGFVDSSRIVDSVKDVRENVSKRKTMRLVLEEAEADIVIEITQSGQIAVGTQTNVRPGIFTGANATTRTDTLPGIVATLRVRGSDYSKEFSFIRQMFWKDLAKYLVNDIEGWVKTNGAQIEALAK